ncbi:DUF2059 domain-containing protein [Pseudaeromonas paramecii]|uniref:DUF2059 domain-containing protein n=1 Tax=Pseudaeromonas paramecii TaxID=2138166 RepID=A0ABP8Q2W4_9GAMM
MGQGVGNGTWQRTGSVSGAGCTGRGRLWCWLVCLALWGSVCRAELPAEALSLADNLINPGQFNQFNQQVLQDLIRQQPELARYQGVVQRWSKETLSWPEVRQGLALHYAQHFTRDEMAQMNVFFATPTGKKYVKYAPLLREETLAVGQNLIQAGLPRLALMLQVAKAQAGDTSPTGVTLPASGALTAQPVSAAVSAASPDDNRR